MTPETLKRYMELPFVLQALQTRTLTLLSPASWDDKNDAYYVNFYRKEKRLKAVLAACLTKAAQTYHHWKVFTHGASGACIYFHKNEIDRWLTRHTELSGKEVVYKTINQLENDRISLDDLPYIKRDAYRHEEEFRILYKDTASKVQSKSFEITLDMIERVVINPWLPSKTVKELEAVIKGISGCDSIRVMRATIVSNDRWKKHAKNIVDAESI